MARVRTITVDTGVQLTVINLTEFNALGVKRISISPLATTVHFVTKMAIDLIGGIFLVIWASDPQTGQIRTTRQLCYVSTAVKGIYLYEDACMALGLITEQFPVVGDCAFIETENKVKSCMASEPEFNCPASS